MKILRKKGKERKRKTKNVLETLVTDVSNLGYSKQRWNTVK